MSTAGRSGTRNRGRAWLVAAVLGLVGVLMLGVFPARTLVAQRAERREVAAQIADLAERNQSLQAQSGLLQSDPEIERLAREQYDLVRPGEEIFDIVAPTPPPPQAAAPAPAVSEPRLARRLLARLIEVF
ncbi:MAG: FtsB family cell division protein [Acidimicrobiales bacterium]